MTLDPERRFDFGEGYGYSPLRSFTGILTFRYFRLYARNLLWPWFPGILNLEELRRYDSENNVLDYVIRTESFEVLAASRRWQRGSLQGNFFLKKAETVRGSRLVRFSGANYRGVAGGAGCLGERRRDWCGHGLPGWRSLRSIRLGRRFNRVKKGTFWVVLIITVLKGRGNAFQLWMRFVHNFCKTYNLVGC